MKFLCELTLFYELLVFPLYRSIMPMNRLRADGACEQQRKADERKEERKTFKKLSELLYCGE